MTTTFDYKRSELQEKSLTELNEILVNADIVPVETEEEAINAICEAFEVEEDMQEDSKEFKPFMSEIQDTKYFHKSDDEIINTRTGELLTAKEYAKLVEKSKRASWELITESNPLNGDEIEDEAEVLSVDVSYVIDGKAFDYEMQLGLNTQSNSIFAVKYSAEKEQEHYINFFEVDNSLLAIVNNCTSGLDDNDNPIDQEDILRKIVSCISPSHIEIADSKPSYQLADGSIIYFDDVHENYKIKTFETINPIKKGNKKRTSLRSLKKRG